MTRNLGFLLALPLIAVMLSGCAVNDPVLRIAFVTTDDDLIQEKDPERFAAFVEAYTGRPTKLVWVSNTQAVMDALISGTADAGFFDGAAAWFAWKQEGLEAIAAEVSGGSTYYVASAWVTDNETYPDMASLRGAVSCHTGLMKSAGMFMPLGWLIKEGLVTPTGDDVTDIEPTARSYFPDAVIPNGGDYSGYNGALRCLSEGAGDVAFIKASTVDSYCPESDWCLEASKYHRIQDFGQVPSHAVMASPHLSAQKQAALVDSLLALAGSTEQDILTNVFETEGFLPVTSESHLGSYGENIQYVPGIQTYVDSKLAK